MGLKCFRNLFFSMINGKNLSNFWNTCPKVILIYNCVFHKWMHQWTYPYCCIFELFLNFFKLKRNVGRWVEGAQQILRSVMADTCHHLCVPTQRMRLVAPDAHCGLRGTRMCWCAHCLWQTSHSHRDTDSGGGRAQEGGGGSMGILCYLSLNFAVNLKLLQKVIYLF